MCLFSLGFLADVIDVIACYFEPITFPRLLTFCFCLDIADLLSMLSMLSALSPTAHWRSVGSRTAPILTGNADPSRQLLRVQEGGLQRAGSQRTTGAFCHCPQQPAKVRTCNISLRATALAAVAWLMASTLPAAASGGLSCSLEDQSVRIAIESGVTRGMGGPVFNFRTLEILDKAVAEDLRRTAFDGRHLPQYRLSERAAAAPLS
jgi:hypothetical protein